MSKAKTGTGPDDRGMTGPEMMRRAKALADEERRKERAISDSVRTELEALADGLAAMDRSDRGAAVARWMEGDDLARLSRYARLDPNGWSAICVRLSAVHGMARHVGRLQVLVRGHQRGLSVADGKEGSAPSPGTRPLGVHWAPDAWRCPPLWTVAPSGVWGPDPQGEGEIQVSRVPLLPVGRLLDVDTGDHHVRLMWPGWTGRPYDRVVRQSVIVDARTLVSSLGDRGAGVNSGNAGLMVRYLDAAMSHNEGTMPVERVVSRCGWVDDGEATGFLLGSEWIGSAQGVSLQVEPGGGEEQFLQAVGSSGTWEGWLQAVGVAADCPDIHLAIYASVASVLMSRLGTARGWVVDWSGETSQGKTTALRAAASVWGEPVDGRMLGSWRSTQAQCEAAAALFQHLPLILDDSKNAKHADDVAQTIYQHSQGRGKGRGKPGVGVQAVGMRRTSEWSSVLLSTGEQSAVSFTQDAGARARCLCLVGPPLGTDSQARSLTVGVLDHHGHLGRRVVEYLAGRDADWWSRLSDRYAARVSAWSSHLAAGGAVAQRLGAFLALLEASKGLAETVGYPTPPKGVEPLQRAVAAVYAGATDADRPLEALRAVYEHVAARSTHMWGRHVMDQQGEAKAPNGGWLGIWSKEDAPRRDATWEIGVLPSTVDRVLSAGGYDPGVVDRWRERGWLAHVGTSYRVRTRIDGARVRLFGLTPKAIEALDLG